MKLSLSVISNDNDLFIQFLVHNTLFFVCWIIWKNHRFAFCTIALCWNGATSWSSCSREIRAFLTYTVITLSWWLGNTRSQGISRHGVCLVFSGRFHALERSLNFYILNCLEENYARTYISVSLTLFTYIHTYQSLIPLPWHNSFVGYGTLVAITGTTILVPFVGQVTATHLKIRHP